MPLKHFILSLLFILSCKLCFAIAFFPEPFARYNVTKTHYLVSIPDHKNYNTGYTAVFETKTNTFLYKIDKYFVDFRVFLSDDGSSLYFLEAKLEGDNEKATLHIYDGKEIISTLEIFNLKSPKTHDNFNLAQIMDIDQELNSLSVYTRDLIYAINLSDQAISNHEIETKTNVVTNMISEDDMNTDSIMDIQNILLKNNQTLTEKLIQDLELEEVTDPSLAEKVIYYSFTISKDNSFSRVNIQVMGFPRKESAKGYELLYELGTEITEMIKSYPYSEHVIPQGVDYWVYTGTLYLAKSRK